MATELLTWHDAAATKPDAGITVLCWGTEGFFTGWWDDEIESWIGCESGGSVLGVSHWADPDGPDGPDGLKDAWVAWKPKDILDRLAESSPNESSHEPLPAQGPVDVTVGGDPQEVAIRITEQGCVLVNAAHLHREGAGIAAVYVDLHSKRAVLSYTGGGDDEPPSVTLEADENTLRLDDSKRRDSTTTFDFPGYPGWRIFATDGPGRYTLAVCLVAPETPNKELTGAAPTTEIGGTT